MREPKKILVDVQVLKDNLLPHLKATENKDELSEWDEDVINLNESLDEFLTSRRYANDDIQLEKRANINYDIDIDVHTSHCCKRHGCKYGKDDVCTVQTGNFWGMTGKCQVCWEMSW